MDNYQKLKEVIQKANPEIMELKFGCEVLSGRTKFVFIKGNKVDYIIYNDEIGATGAATIIDKILGRPIRLADVLYAIQQVDQLPGIAIEEYGVWLKHDYEGYGEVHDGDKRVKWDLLHDNLDHQSEKTKQFLINLLV